MLPSANVMVNCLTFKANVSRVQTAIKKYLKGANEKKKRLKSNKTHEYCQVG
jgi:hypothetical protein